MTTASATITNSIKVSDLKAGGYHRAKNEFVVPATVLEILGYIDFLSMSNSFDAANLELPIKGEDGKLYLDVPVTDSKIDRTFINALYFSFVEKEKANVVVTKPDDNVKKAILNAVERRKKSRVEAIKRSIVEQRNNALRYMEDAHSFIRQARTKELEISDITGADQTVYVEKMIESLSETNFNFHRYFEGDNMIEFVNRSDVILKYQDARLGLDYALNCGKYKLRINLNEMGVKLSKHINNVGGNEMHPHALHDHRPCWGNAADTITNAMIAGDVATIIRVVDSLLTNYNPSSPYIGINDFQRRVVERDERMAKEYGQRLNQKGAPSTQEEWIDDETLDDEPLDEDFFDGDE